MCVCACVRVSLLTLIYLMHWLSRRINTKGMASLSSFSPSCWRSHSVRMRLFPTVCVCVYCYCFSFSIYYFSAASNSSSSSPSFLSFSWIFIYLLYFLLLSDEFGWRWCPTADNVSVFSISLSVLCISLQLHMCVDLVGSPIPKAIRKNKDRKEKKWNERMDCHDHAVDGHLYTVIVPVQSNEFSNPFRLFCFALFCFVFWLAGFMCHLSPLLIVVYS